MASSSYPIDSLLSYKLVIVKESPSKLPEKGSTGYVPTASKPSPPFQLIVSEQSISFHRI